MRNFVFGSIGVVLGLALLAGSLLAGGTSAHGTGAYAAGQSAGSAARIPLGVILLLAGVWAIRKEIRGRAAG